MKTTRKYPLSCLVALLGLLPLASTGALAQTTPPIGATTPGAESPQAVNDHFNPPPCDFNDAFYTANGMSVSQLDTPGAARFGFFRQFGPPASGNQANWVVDNTCATNDPTRKNVRILATTGGYSDDGLGQATHFISIIAFVLNQGFFTGVANARDIQMVDIVSHFEAYAANKQILPDGTFAITPCGSMGTGDTHCFPVTSVATPALRQDWRFATNRNAIDGTDGNDPLNQGGGGASNSPFGYFCDDLLGMWIITYFWFTVDPHNPGSTCGPILDMLADKNGLSLDGTPIIKTADELNNDLEAHGCGAEGQEAAAGPEDGPGWLICPSLPDPRAGAISKDAFLDTVRRRNGTPVDPAFNANFNCLQQTGSFPQANGKCLAPGGAGGG